jgi:cell wall-associated NlpC family hydrolase
MMLTAVWASAASAAGSGGASASSSQTASASKGKKAGKSGARSSADDTTASQPSELEQDPASAGGAGLGYVPHSSDTRPTVPGSRAVFRHGIAYAPAAAPIEVQKAVWAANALLDKPYVYGGGHGSFKAAGYDCSGTVSYALHGAGLLDTPMDSSDFLSFGDAGKGRWITVYTNPGHAFAIIAGLRLDTSGPGESGPRWRPGGKYSTAGFKARHPANY